MMILEVCFVFAIGCFFGWCMEFVFRRIVHHKWINPGFLVGPYLPLYGTGLTILYLLSLVDFSFVSTVWVKDVIIILLITISMTLIEYITGLIFIKGMHVKLWDYSDQWGNIEGIICPLFTFFWGVIGAVYFFFVHPYIKQAAVWISTHLEFSFFLGLFFGVFIIDVCYSLHVVSKIKKWAKENQVVVRYESLKESMQERKRKFKEKITFAFPFHTEKSLKEELEYYKENFPLNPRKWKFMKRVGKKEKTKVEE